MNNGKIIKTQITEVSEWIYSLNYRSVPAPVIELAKLQILDVIAAVCAGSLSNTGKKIRTALEATRSEGLCTNFFTSDKRSLFETVYLHAAYTNALELDNLVFMGHVGQSAVNVPLSLAEMFNIDSKKMIVALIAAVEVSGRMGGYFALGPQQGHMRSYLHRVAGAVATAKLLELNPNQIAKSISIALSMPEFPLYPASFSPETKVLCTSSPSVEGIRAGFLAAENFDPALDILEHPAGFSTYFTYLEHPPEIWKHIGETWSLFALCSKMFAACAYAQGPVTAALEIVNENEIEHNNIESVKIFAPITTVAMESFSVPHLGASLTPVNTKFSTCRSVAAALINKSLIGAFYSGDKFENLSTNILKLSDKIVLNTDWQMSIDLIKGIDSALSNPGEPGIFGMVHTQKTFSHFKKMVGSQSLISLKDIPLIFRIPTADRNYLLKRYWRGYKHKLSFMKSGDGDKFTCYEKDLSKFSFHQSGKVEVKLKNGQVFESVCKTPPGFAGDTDRENNIRKKFTRELSQVYSPERIQKIIKLVYDLPNTGIRDLASCLNK